MISSISFLYSIIKYKKLKVSFKYLLWLDFISVILHVFICRSWSVLFVVLMDYIERVFWSVVLLHQQIIIFLLYPVGAAVAGWCGSMRASQPAWPQSTRMWSWVETPTCPLWRSGLWKNTQKWARLMPMVSSTSREGLTHIELRYKSLFSAARKHDHFLFFPLNSFSCLVQFTKHSLHHG